MQLYNRCCWESTFVLGQLLTSFLSLIVYEVGGNHKSGESFVEVLHLLNALAQHLAGWVKNLLLIRNILNHYLEDLICYFQTINDQFQDYSGGKIFLIHFLYVAGKISNLFQEVLD